jgi:GT2 family glycosyltransferase
MKPKISIQILSMNRPALLSLTLSSVLRALAKSTLNFEIVLLDNGSNKQTLAVIEQYESRITKAIFCGENTGMGNGWSTLAANSSAEYFLTLENDWWCGRTTDKWLQDAIEILDTYNKIGLVKLRSIGDSNPHGYAEKHYRPWSKLRMDHVSQGFANGRPFEHAESTETSFTFNPVLVRRELISSLSAAFVDEWNGEQYLLSTENRVNHAWQTQNLWRAAALLRGPFHHIGFHSRRDRYPALPSIMVREWLLKKFA